ncbi:hypothetical protein HM131_09855 [Halobacillus mangrovi]|uniref:Uncharacterized protein n=1 Tax=Halobacillus mangrovi TaxID=402384 RepID=A0A1W5ZUZ2_9BACI|nr:hypothetical protein HM131_09855 [Halobacillus mangrovi]
MVRLLREWNGWQDPTESIANEEACRHPRGKRAISPNTFPGTRKRKQSHQSFKVILKLSL